MDYTPAKRRRWFQFRLRTLMLLVAAGAAFSWVYCVGWPWWQIYIEQMTVEQAAKQLKPGMTLDKAGDILFAGTNRLHTMHYQTAFENGDFYGAVHFETTRSDYIAFFEFQKGNGPPRFNRVQVFRLPPVPIGYKARTNRGRSSLDSPPGNPADLPLDMYMEDVFEFLCGSRKGSSGFQYELIYSDPSDLSISN